MEMNIHTHKRTLTPPMKLPIPTLERQLSLARVIVAGEISKSLISMPKGGFSDDKLQATINDNGLSATLDEIRLLVQSLHEIFAVDMAGVLTSAMAAVPFEGLSVERELELLQELFSRQIVSKIVNKSDFVAQIPAVVTTRKSYVTIAMTPEELAFMAVTAVNAYAARFQTAVESAF